MRQALSIPLPYLTVIIGRLFGKTTPSSSGVPEDDAARAARRARVLPRSLRVTREGKWFIGLLLVIGVAAINTGNNLLYLVVATLLSLIIISGVMSESTLRGIRAGRSLPKTVYKGRAARAVIKAANTKRLVPSFSFTVREEAVPGVEARPAYALKVEAGRTAAMAADYLFTRRGKVALNALSVTTRFPFGLFIKGKREAAPASVLVYPAVRPLAKKYAVEASRAGEASRARRGRGTLYQSAREYTEEDDARFILWRQAARTGGGEIYYKETEEETGRRILVLFDNHPSDSFEELVDEAASVAAHFISKGHAVGLKALTLSIEPRHGQNALFGILNALALIKPADAAGAASVRVAAV